MASSSTGYHTLSVKLTSSFSKGEIVEDYVLPKDHDPATSDFVKGYVKASLVTKTFMPKDPRTSDPRLPSGSLQTAACRPTTEFPPGS